MDAPNAVILQRGTIVVLRLDAGHGHEQSGTRPCVVVSDPLAARGQRFPMVAIVPLTSTPGKGVLRPKLRPGVSGLKRNSFALIEQLRSVDKRRIIRAHGVVAHMELNAIDWGMLLYLGLAEPGHPRVLPVEE